MFHIIKNRNLWINGKARLITRSYSTGSNSKSAGGFKNYLKSLKWFSIPASVGFAYIAYLQLGHIQKREKRNIEQGSTKSLVLEEWQVDILKLLPTRVLSRWWGYLSHLEIPTWLREPILNAYVKMYDCNMDEAVIGDLQQFPTFSEFFKRKLKPGARPIEQESELVSPVDGKVLYFGEINSSYTMEQVKGVHYSLVSFLGPRHPLVREIIKSKMSNRNTTKKDENAASKSVNAGKSNEVESDESNESRAEEVENAVNVQDSSEIKNEKLYYCILYLAPGDYHWFHSPADWTIEHRRHIPGHLFSVNPSVMRSVEGLFNFNERVILHGHWKHGSLLMAAVGAYNVGSVHLEFAVEKALKTNIGALEKNYLDRLYGAMGSAFKRGEPLGGFDLGSSIVLIFSAKEKLKFQIEPGQKIKLGETIVKL